MSIRDNAENLLKALADELSLDDETRAALAFDDNNESIITLEERFIVAMYLDEDASALMLSLPIAPLPQDESRDEVMMELLLGNHAWSLTEGGTLGVDKHTGLITLCYLVHLPLEDASRFVATVGHLISVVDYWKNEIQEITASETVSQPEDMVAANFIRG